MYFKRRYRIAVWAVSIPVGLLVVFIPLLLGLYTPQEPYIIPINDRVNNTMAFGLIIAFLFPAVVEYNNYSWARRVDRNVPRLLRDVTEAVRSGITLPRALEEASKRDYGPISKELEHAISKFILEASWEDSLMSFARHLGRPSALRLSTVLIEAHQTGGRMIDVLEASVNVFSSLDEYREERYTQMKPYTMVIYMSTLIFLVVAYVVLYQFLTPLCEASTAAVTQEAGVLGGVLDINYYNSVLFWASILESIFGGLIAGKIGDGALAAGLRHSVVLSIITLAFFNLIKFGVA
jgi:flagellar protein FlaJ